MDLDHRNVLARAITSGFIDAAWVDAWARERMEARVRGARIEGAYVFARVRALPVTSPTRDELLAEIDDLRKRLSEEAQCATFLASRTGRQLLARLGVLGTLEDALRWLVPEVRALSTEAMVREMALIVKRNDKGLVALRVAGVIA